MADRNEFDFDSIIFEYLDKFRFLLSPDQWSAAFLDYSKNEIFALLFLYKNRSANMTEIAEYIKAPLNTATGVIGRLEKKAMVERKRSNEDRRVVNIILTKNGRELISQEKKIIEYYFQEVYKQLTDEEKSAVFGIVSKAMAIFKKEKDTRGGSEMSAKKIRKIIIE